jgi:hypothetical protein
MQNSILNTDNNLLGSKTDDPGREINPIATGSGNLKNE